MHPEVLSWKHFLIPSHRRKRKIHSEIHRGRSGSQAYFNWTQSPSRCPCYTEIPKYQWRSGRSDFHRHDWPDQSCNYVRSWKGKSSGCLCLPLCRKWSPDVSARQKKCSHEISLYEPIGTDREGNEVNLYDIIESTETDIPERIHLKDNIQKLYEKLENELSPREKLVLKMRYGLYQGEEYTQREIAAQLGISRSYVSRIESAIGKLRQYFWTF